MVKTIGRISAALVACWALGQVLAPSGLAAETDDTSASTRTIIALDFEAGAWRTKVQQVFDASTKTLVRKAYTVWDPMPSRDLDFAWVPDRPSEPGRVNGTGHLIWRIKGKAAYDSSSFYADYRGLMKQGKAKGRGVYTTRAGVSYDGNWKNGAPDGPGTLKLGNGAEYVGQFRNAKAQGQGKYFDVDGETFEGTFDQGLRSGSGLTNLPNGSSYRSQWVKGEEVPASRRLRLAQLGPVLAAADDVRLGIAVEKAPDNDESGSLRYVASNTDSALAIQPDNKRLMDMWKGNAEIQLTDGEESGYDSGRYGVFAYTSAELPPLGLILEVQNRSSAPLRVVGAYLDVEASATDLQPAIQLTVGGGDQCSIRLRDKFSPAFEMENFGWGPAERAKICFALVNPKTGTRPSNLPMSKDLGTIGGKAKVNLEADLRAAGMNIGLLKQRAKGEGFKCKSDDAAACFAEIVKSGVFGRLADSVGTNELNIGLNAVGTLEYTWKDQTGAEKTRTSPFTTFLLLGHLPIAAECGEGGDADRVKKTPLQLRLDQTRYRLPVPFERTIPQGRTSRYVVPLQAAKSSRHNFKVVIQLADGRQVTSRPINLQYFTPNWSKGLTR